MAYTKRAVEGLALFVKESLDSGDVSHNDLQSWLSDAVRDYCGNSWGYLVDFIGDGESGDVIFCCNGELKKCGYSILQFAGKVTAQLDDEDIVDVLPHTVYEEEADEDEHYASMEAERLYTIGATPLCERFIGKAKRDAMSAEDFAGKGKSFPISTQQDYDAAVRSVGRAGPGNYDSATLLKKADAIGKRKGLKLRKAARGAEAKEAGKGAQAMHDKAVAKGNQKQHDTSVKFGASCPSDCKMGGKGASEAAPVTPADVKLVEPAAFPQTFELRESTAVNPLVKIISPGRGTSGYYTKELLERDGPQIFKRGTLMYVNHATEAEEAARPEGDWQKLAAVTVGDAYWDDHGKDGAALYAPAKVFSGFAQEVAEKAPYTGVSIRAGGKRDDKAIAPDGKAGLITALTSAESIDLVTRAGRDGKLLLESAPTSTQPQESEMTDAEKTQLREALAEVKKLKERQATAEVPGVVAEYLRTCSVSEAIAQRVTKRVLDGTIPFTEAGELDRAKVKQFAETQLTDELSFLRSINPSLVVGMGSATQSQQLTEAQQKEAKAKVKESKKALKESNKRFASLMSSNHGNPLGKVGCKILIEGRAAFDPNYNSRLHGAVVTGGGGSMPQLEA